MNRIKNFFKNYGAHMTAFASGITWGGLEGFVLLGATVFILLVQKNKI